MRSFAVVVVGIIGLGSCAQAADLPGFPALRGGFVDGLTTSTVNWEGFYLGGQGGYGSSDENFRGSTRTTAAEAVANTLIESALRISEQDPGLGKISTRSSGYGAFAGYNWQWDDVVLGMEVSYLHGKFGGTTSASQERVSASALADNLFHDTKVTSSASMSISDLATFRGRAAYAWGSFLPYMFGGLALGNADIIRSVLVQDAASATQVGPFIPFVPLSASEGLHNHLIYGYSAGLGVDVNLIGGLFMRAEWEYIRFTSAVDTSINTVRAGLGYKF
jgi:outer membrane immunogenic protein